MKSCWASLLTALFAVVCQSVAPQPTVGVPEQNLPSAPHSGRLQTELLKLYLVRARIQDLLSLLHGANWKMPDAEGASFQQKIAATNSQLQTLEYWRYQLLYHPQGAASGQQTLKALENVVAAVREIGEDAGHHQSTEGAQLAQTAKDLSELRDDIQSDLAAEFPGKFAPVTASTAGSETPKAVEQGPPATHASSTARVAPETEAATENTVAAPVAIPHPLLKPEQVQKILLDVYFVAARVNDLLSLAQPENWKMTDADRTAFEDRVKSARSALTTLEKWRYQFSYHPQDTTAGDRTVAAIGNLLPQIQELETTIGQSGGASAATRFKQPEEQLTSFKNSLAAYLASLRAAYQRELAGGTPGSGALPTERISVAGPPPPVQYLPGLTPPLTDAQVKSILYQIYVSVYRIHDLLNQEHPNAWKAPEATRAAESSELASLLARISELQKWRGLLSEYPDNMYDAFEMYRSVEDLSAPLDAFSGDVSKYESASLASDYVGREGDLQARLGDLTPYIGFILKHESRSVALYQSDLAACQNRLGYAMHSSASAAIPMRNILPDFKGRRTMRGKAKSARGRSRPPSTGNANSKPQ